MPHGCVVRLTVTVVLCGVVEVCVCREVLRGVGVCGEGWGCCGGGGMGGGRHAIVDITQRPWTAASRTPAITYLWSTASLHPYHFSPKAHPSKRKQYEFSSIRLVKFPVGFGRRASKQQGMYKSDMRLFD